LCRFFKIKNKPEMLETNLKKYKYMILNYKYNVMQVLEGILPLIATK